MVIFGTGWGSGTSRHTRSNPGMYDTPYDTPNELVAQHTCCFHQTSIGDVPIKKLGVGGGPIGSAFQLMCCGDPIVRVSYPGMYDA